jgi:phage baseplate assembly protein W
MELRWKGARGARPPLTGCEVHVLVRGRDVPQHRALRLAIRAALSAAHWRIRLRCRLVTPLCVDELPSAGRVETFARR